MSYTASVEFSERCCGKRRAVLSDKSLLSLVRINGGRRNWDYLYARPRASGGATLYYGRRSYIIIVIMIIAIIIGHHRAAPRFVVHAQRSRHYVCVG